MKTFVTRVLAFALLLSAIALGQTFVAGFPSNVGGSSGSGSGDSFWYDAGVIGSTKGYIATADFLVGNSGGSLPVRTGTYNNSNAEVFAVGTLVPAGFSALPYMGFHRGNQPWTSVGSFATLEGALALGGSTGEMEVWGRGSVSFYTGGMPSDHAASASIAKMTTTSGLELKWANSGLPGAGTQALKFTYTGATFDLGAGTNDYMYSDGTGLVTPGYVRVGNYSDAGLPLPTSIPGAIAYNTSQGAPVWSDGTAWQSFGSGGGGNYWYDGGAGSIQANVYGLALVRDAGGSTFNFIFEDSTTANNGQLRFIPNINPAHTPILQLNGNGDNYQVSIGSNTSNGAALYVAKNASTAGIQMAGAYIASSAPAGQWAFKADVTGAWWQVGAGSTDYFVSDGVGIITPGYWASSAAFSSTPGVRAYAVQPFPASTILYSAAAASGQGAGAISFDATRQELQVVRNSQFNPLGGPTFDRMGWRTSIPATPTYADGGIPLLLDGGTIYTAPYITSTVYVTQPTITGGSLDTNFLVERNSGPDRNSVNLAGYTYFPLTTAASIAAQVTTIQITSQGGGAQSLIPTTGQPSMCSVLRTGDVTTVNYYSGMVDVLNIVGGINTSAHAYFMYVPGTSANWQTCVYDTADHCTTTAVPVVANTRYRLCVYVNAARGYTAYIDGNYVSGSDAFLLPSGLAMAPLTAVETQAAAARALYIGPYEVQYQ